MEESDMEVEFTQHLPEIEMKFVSGMNGFNPAISGFVRVFFTAKEINQCGC